LNNPSPDEERSDLADVPDRKEYMTKYYAENKGKISRQRKARRDAFKDELNTAARERYANDPVAREQRSIITARYKRKIKANRPTDPELQKKHQEELAKRRERHKERLATDPEYRKMIDARNANQREKHRLKKKQSLSD